VKSGRTIGFVIGSVLALASSAFAVPITFTHTSNGSGVIGGTPFTDAEIFITAIGDTAAQESLGLGGVFFIDHSSASIEIEGQGTFSFITPTRTFVSNTSSTVGFSRAGISGLDLLTGPGAAAFATWDMLSSIGPITTVGSFRQWDSSPVLTSGGVVDLIDGPATITFEAVVGVISVPVPDVTPVPVPEPASLPLLALGLAGARFFSRPKRS
jgi:PEP-CTERM motif-containing protein